MRTLLVLPLTLTLTCLQSAAGFQLQTSGRTFKHPCAFLPHQRDQNYCSAPGSTATRHHLFGTGQAQPDTPPTSTNDKGPSWALNLPAAAVWVALVAWTFTAAPGQLQSPEDTAMLTAIIADPVHPGLNELYYTIFNFFAVIPVILAAVILPQAQPRQGLPAAPFLFLSSVIGYFGFGPYLALRAPPKEEIDPSQQVGWFTRNVTESKICNVLTLLFTLYLPVAAGLVPAYQDDPTQLWQGFTDIVSTSRFASVSLADLTILLACTVSATPRDYLLRHPEATQQQAVLTAAATALLPFVGSAIYCVVRPPLPQAADDA